MTLAHLPTPLEPAPRLAAALGLRDLWIKRDDCTGLAMGGNKARKLEYLVADALNQQADTLLTTGGAQSNHARMTAAAACRCGLRCMLFLSGPEPEEQQGNLLLDQLFGAEIRFHPGEDYDAIDLAMEAEGRRLVERGRRPYIIPVGGSTPLGCLGYVAAVRELAAQAREAGIRPDVMVAAVGSTGTLAGLLIGRQISLPGCRLVGISVSRDPAAAGARAAEIARAGAIRLGLGENFDPGGYEVRGEWVGEGYGIPTEAGDRAVLAAARTEGLVLDSIYTGKAMAGLEGLAASGEIATGETVVFWHTGGGAALFAGPPRGLETGGENGC